ncbi:uncharacterized protein Tco025E_01856 [Trypanosoma conorhini]|uniref:Uncharacterized protein n=1 Tax=Trypanosoma conorhini TaxID=83891 RepID=A0A3R7PIQ2_9TRYP|nr:uncharacterized protein Tco025E_01856 [Trypanosoma conorhini]RNF25890.1 hypothetical protein Tco025E_01856 [Trypanosoma conorhini]
MPPVNSGYTFEDFLKRLERSPVTHMSPLYHEHRELFVRRPDMFSRAVGSITWEKGCALLDAAYHAQPIALVTYRALLARMLLHNQYVRRRGSGNLVPWSAALRTYSEAILAHGNAVPTRMTISALRLLAPQRQWAAAVALLKLSQANEKLTIPMLVDAAGCCATPSAWQTAMALLGHVHAQAPNLLPDCIQSLRPVGTDAATVSAAANALISDRAGPTPEQKRVLAVLSDVVAAVPWQTAVSNEMCTSHLTHLVASTTYTTQEKTEALLSATRQLPCEAFMQLMMAHDAPALASSSGGSTPPTPTPTPTTATVGEQPRKALELSPLNSPVVRESLQLLAKAPETAVPFLATIIGKLPSAKTATRFLSEAATMYRDTLATAMLRHPLVVSALLRKCSEEAEWRLASSVLLSMSPIPLPCEVASALVLQMREARQPSLVVDILQKSFVPAKVALTPQAMEAALVCVLAHNRAISASDARRTPETLKRKQMSQVHWLSALSWATDLVQDEAEGRILQTGSAASSGAVSYSPPKLVPRQKPLSPRMLSLLIHICVGAGNPQGALHAMGYARAVDKTELAQSEAIRALLYCMMYDRPYEAEAILKEAEKKHGKEQAQYLERLLVAVQEAKQEESGAPEP